MLLAIFLSGSSLHAVWSSPLLAPCGFHAHTFLPYCRSRRMFPHRREFDRSVLVGTTDLPSLLVRLQLAEVSLLTQ